MSPFLSLVGLHAFFTALELLYPRGNLLYKLFISFISLVTSWWIASIK